MINHHCSSSFCVIVLSSPIAINIAIIMSIPADLENVEDIRPNMEIDIVKLQQYLLEHGIIKKIDPNPIVKQFQSGQRYGFGFAMVIVIVIVMAMAMAIAMCADISIVAATQPTIYNALIGAWLFVRSPQANFCLQPTKVWRWV